MDGRDHLGSGLKRATIALVALFLLLTTVLGAFALTVSAPKYVDEGKPISVSVTGGGQVFIWRDGQLVASGAGTASDALPTNSTSAGLYEYIFGNATRNETRTIEVLDVPLQVTITAPQTDIAAAEAMFSLRTNLKADLCYVNIDGVSHTLQPDAAQTAFSGSFPLEDGPHTIEYKCRLGSEVAVRTKAIHVDAAPPRVTASSPTGEVTGPYVTLAVETDEIAQCRYGPADGPYDALPSAMSTTFAMRNTVTLAFSEQASYTYFVRCKDVGGNTMASSAIISFLGKLPPSASIEIEGDEPLKAGTYPVKLVASMPLSDPPRLDYALQESGARHQVALTGEDDRWSGFVTIPVNIPDTVISFTFEGTSRSGVKGTAITSTSLFTVDAVPPKAIDSIAIDNTSAHIKLKWFTTASSDVSAYNIYRSDGEGVSYTDYLTSTKQTEFTDRAADKARYYYYRVAPIDLAGNIGPLSAEVYGSAIDEAVKEAQVAADPMLHARLDEEMAAMTAALLDANATISALEREGNTVSVQIIKEMGLIAEGRAAVRKMEEGMAILAELRARSPSAAEVDDGIARSRKLLGEARTMLIKRITPQEQAEVRQPADQAGLERNLAYALVGQELSAADRDAYVRDALALQDKITVTVFASSFRLYDMAGQEQQYTLVKKRVSLQVPQNDVLLVENIPKSVAQDAKDIRFETEPVVLQADPVVAYKFPVLELHEYKYGVKRLVSLDEVKKSRTFIYPAPPAPAAEAPEQETGMLTGYATKISMPGIGSTDGLLIGIGVLVLLGLGAYYVSLSSERPFRGLPGPVPPRAGMAARMANRIAPVRRIVMPGRAPVHPAAPVASRIINTPLNSGGAAGSAAAVPPASPPSVPPSSDSVRAMLEEAERAVDAKEYHGALSRYKEALGHLERDEDLARILADGTTRVYAKLLLFRHLTDANAAAQRKDAAALRDALAEVRQAAAQVGEEDTVLIREAKSSYAGFVRTLNTLEIEQAGRY